MFLPCGSATSYIPRHGNRKPNVPSQQKSSVHGSSAKSNFSQCELGAKQMNHRLTLELFLAISAILPSESQITPPSMPMTETQRVLSAASRIRFEIPMFGSSGRVGCDSAGDMVFNVARGVFDQGPFLRVRSDGRAHLIYSLPREIAGKGNIVWAISPGGTFYVLHEDFKMYKPVRFSEDGSVGTVTNLDVPPGVDIWFLAITDNGAVFVRGYQDELQPRGKKRAGFTAIYDESGRMRHDLSADTPAFDLGALAKHPFDGDVVAGEDGRFYILQEKKVLVVNQAGAIERELSFQKPIAESNAVRIDYSKGVISLILHSISRTTPNQAADVEVRAVLLNAQTGEQRATYVFSPTTTGTVLCFNLEDGYSLMAIDGKLAAKDIVPIR
jgi:hypothetical protein